MVPAHARARAHIQFNYSFTQKMFTHTILVFGLSITAGVTVCEQSKITEIVERISSVSARKEVMLNVEIRVIAKVSTL